MRSLCGIYHDYGPHCPVYYNPDVKYTDNLDFFFVHFLEDDFNEEDKLIIPQEFMSYEP